MNTSQTRSGLRQRKFGSTAFLHTMFLLLAVALLLGAGLCEAKADTEYPVSSMTDFHDALANATAGNPITLVLQTNISCPSSLDGQQEIVIPSGATVTVTNAPGRQVTFTREYDVWGIPFSPMVTVEGELIIQENTSGGGSLTFDGDNKDFKDNAMFAVTGEMTIHSGTFINSKAKNGGVLSGVAVSVVNINGGTFRGNTATSAGGVVSTFGELNIADGTFTDSTALWGGAVYAGDTSVVTVSGGAFRNNSAINGGAGGVICAYGELNIDDGTFEGNDALQGGVVYFSGSASGKTFTMTGGTMTRKGATCSYGGAIELFDGNARITGGTFTGNTARAWGGALFIDVDASAFLSRVLIYNNHSTIHGGGVFNCGTGNGDYQKFLGLTLYQNTSSGNPGGSAGDDFFSLDKATSISPVYLSNYTLDGANCPWYKDDSGRRYVSGDSPAPSSYYQNTTERFALKSGCAAASFQASEALAWVKFSGNSGASGGAIANNGKINVGYASSLTLKKNVDVPDSPAAFTFDITLTDENGQPYSASIMYMLNGVENTLVFDAAGQASLQLRGGQEATLYGIPLGFQYQISEQQAVGFTQVSAINSSGIITPDAQISIFTNRAAVSSKSVPQTGDPFALRLLLLLAALSMAGSLLAWNSKRARNQR